MDITCALLVDKKVSVRINDREVYILPSKQNCSMDDIASAIVASLEHVIGEEGDGEWF